MLEHDTKSGVATVMAEKTLAFCRLKVKGSDVLNLNQRIYIGKDRTKRTEVQGILGMAHMDKMSNMAKQDLPTLVQTFIEEHGQYFVDEFYNKAGPMSLKQHSYELLPDVGPVKARNMVKARDQVGRFASMDELNALAKVKGAELLAQRFIEEMEDKTLVPRLTELLLPVEAGGALDVSLMLCDSNSPRKRPWDSIFWSMTTSSNTPLNGQRWTSKTTFSKLDPGRAC